MPRSGVCLYECLNLACQIARPCNEHNTFLRTCFSAAAAASGASAFTSLKMFEVIGHGAL